MGHSLHKRHPMESLGNAAAARGEIRVERLERRLKPRVPFPHRHDFYHFIYLEGGSGWHEIDFRRFPAGKGQLFFVKPGEVHAWELGVKTRGFVLEFTEESLGDKTVLAALEAAPSTSLRGKDPLPAQMLALMHEEFSERREYFRLSLEHLLQAFLLHLARGQGKAAPISRDSLPEKFRALVELHYRHEHSVEFYAQKLAVSPKRLTTKVTRALGKSAGAWIHERCLLEAKRLLAYSDFPIAEIGYRIGFEDPNYFARFFRQRSGLSPGKFRKLASHRVGHK